MEAVDTAAIERLLKPFAKLDEQQLRLTSTYIDLLLKWNARINLTAVRGAEEIVTRHFGESFFAAEILRAQRPVRRGIDLGAGAGFPGIPAALLMPESRFVLIESNHKKATFLKEVVFALKLANASVFTGRGEDYPDRADLVTMRAVERFEKALPTALHLLEPAGRIALMIGLSQTDAAKDFHPEVEWKDPVSVPGGHSRILLVGTRMVKVGPE
jgi:16S rRNA (guanine527-N7)-methyltransferase